MSNGTCSFSSISDLLGHGESGLNITNTIAACPQICSLAWGYGNPDLSGIGVNISYIIQAVLTILCGPLLLSFYKLRKQLKIQVSNHTLKHISDLHEAYLNISAQFSIPVAIAAVVRVTQKAPFYELAFLRALITMQFLSLLSTALTVGLFEGDHRRDHRREVRHIVITILYVLVEFAFYMGLIGSLTTSNASWTSLVEFTDSCIGYGQIFPWIHQLPPPPKINLPTVKDEDYRNPFNKQVWKLTMIVVGFAFAGFFGLMLSGFILWLTVKVIKKLRKKDRGWIVVVLTSLALGIAVQVELAEMERLRNLMKTITGPDFQDDQWGFGQVIALFLWMPFCIQFAFYVIDAFINSKSDEEPSPLEDKGPSPSSPPQPSLPSRQRPLPSSRQKPSGPSHQRPSTIAPGIVNQGASSSKDKGVSPSKDEGTSSSVDESASLSKDVGKSSSVDESASLSKDEGASPSKDEDAPFSKGEDASHSTDEGTSSSKDEDPSPSKEE